MKRLVIGILAHVDSGKTTLSEALLYRAGALRRPGRVDHGDAFLDNTVLERERGITIFSKQAVLALPKVSVTLVDTPGHVDFSPETERTLQVLDYAVLVISGTDGVQSHTLTLWQLLRRYRVPVFLFVNKMDLPGPGREAILAELRERLDAGCTAFPAGEGELPAEELALCGEVLLEEYLSAGRVSEKTVAAAVAQRRVFPCWFGSALKSSGVEALLRAFADLTEAPAAGADFGARVFKIGSDAQGARLTWLKVTGGSLRVKTLLSGGADGESWTEKVNQLRVYSGLKYTAVEEALPGMVCAATGLTHARPGEGLGVEGDAAVPLLEPVMTYRVCTAQEDVHGVLQKLRSLEEEAPELHVVWNDVLGEIRVQLMGEVQLEVLRRLAADRFGLALDFDRGSILYKETIAAPVEGVGHYEPLRHYAEVHLLLEPGERGSGLHFASVCRTDDLSGNWQRLILSCLTERAHLGVLTGAPLTDVRITLLAGRASVKHTDGGDFREAAWRAVRQGLRRAQSVLLEPWYDFRLEVPTDCIGRALSDLERFSAGYGAPKTQGETAVLTGSAAVAVLQGYAGEVAAYTRGQGRLTCTPAGYRPCRQTEEIVAAAGYDPDADLANSADSIFCAHGAGFLVKWDRVRDYMHLDTGAEKPADAPEPAARPARPTSAAGPARSWEDDKELVAIFERTYGPLKRDPRTAFRSARRAPAAVSAVSTASAETPASPPAAATAKSAAVVSAKPSAPLAAPEKPSAPAGATEYLLVDGYNVVFAWEDLATLAAQNLDAARTRLMDMLCNYRGWHPCELILVFDAYRVRGNPGEASTYHNIHVVYTKEAETADMYIEKATHRLGQGHRVRVVTSDGLEQLIILGHGALRVPALAFRTELDEAVRAIRACLGD